MAVWRSAVRCLGCALGVFVLFTGSAVAEGGLSLGGVGGSPLQGSLVVPGSLVEGELVVAQREARRFSPGAFAARWVAETAYEHLDAAGARALAQRVFPRLVDEPAGGPPPLPSGARVVKATADNVVQVALRGGEHAVEESLQPVALETSRGRHSLIDLHLRDVGGAFEPSLPAVGVRVPRRLGVGVGLGGTGVSLTPVGADGLPLSGSEGEVQGVTVSYANTLMDGDTMVKPTTFGFSAETLLRSVNSPRVLYFRVGVPSGARLVAAREGAGAEVVEGGRTIARVSVPSAHDAEGTVVALSVRVLSGGVVSVSLPSFGEGAYRMPIVVDPEVSDTIWQNELLYGVDYYKTEWSFAHSGSLFQAPEHPEGGSWTEKIEGSHTASEFGGLYYKTRGESQIISAHVTGNWNDSRSHIANSIDLYAPKVTNGTQTESYAELPEVTEPERGETGVVCAPARNCAGTKAGGAPEENGNSAGYVQEAFGSGEGHPGENTVTKASVLIKQEKGPELEFNKTSETIYDEETKEYIPNVLYAGHESWLGQHHGAFEVRAKDPGIGLSYYLVYSETPGWFDEKFYYEYGGPWCYGIQCPEHNYQPYFYQSGMPNGETPFRGRVKDKAELSAEISSQKIKIDNTPPHSLKVVGLQNGNELPTGEPHLKVEATDGEGSTPSSGVKSVKVKIDGHEVSGSSAFCERGPCTASTEFTVASRDYTNGTHSLVVAATDNAGNVAEEEFTFRVHGASPVSLGPGSVDPSSGQYTLSAGDVSLSGVAGVSRTYQSRHLEAGANGPLGPQWAIDLGGSEGLTVLPTGSVLLDSSSGGETMFMDNEKSELESPKGDSNLKLEFKGEEHRYVVKDATAGSETVYEQPAATQTTPAVFGNAFGWEPGQLKRPVSDALDPAGDLWVTDWTGDLVAKFSPTGALLAEYGSEGSAGLQFDRPWGVAVNQRTGNVYVTDDANNRVEELSSSGAFIKAFGWGVSDGKAEYEVCTKECRAGLAGSGNGQFSGLEGVSVDSSGDVWAADYGNDRVEEFNEAGSYVRQFGGAGTGGGQFEEPMDIAFAGGDVYVTDQRNNRVEEFSGTGSFIEAFGWGVANGEEKLETCTSSCKAGIAGSGNGQYDLPRGLSVDPVSGDLYVTEIGGERVQEVTTSGAFVSKFGSGGSGEGQFAQPMGVVVSSEGAIYVTDFEHAQVQEWSRPRWWPVSAKGPLSVATTYAYAPVEGASGTTSMQPYEVLAPAPAGVSCGTKPEELKAGCRALTFKYATATTAKGESESEWGEYKGDLSEVVAHVYNPAAKAMEEKAVAQYSFDKQGRLRAEWDPRVSSEDRVCTGEEHKCASLKTVYGYDGEGHVVALTPPGQESWAFTYGTISGDSNTGRLLKVTRAPASTKLWDGQAPVNSEAPRLSGTPAVGVRMSVSDGVWSNSPVVYSYQWERCNVEGWEPSCGPIAGATSANYTPGSSDLGQTLRARVTAINGGSPVAATSAVSVIVQSKAGAYTQFADRENSVGGASCISGTSTCVLSDSSGKALYATNVSASAAATWKLWGGPSGLYPSEALDCPSSSLCLMADGSKGNLYYATSLGGAWSEAFSPVNYGVDAVGCAPSASLCIAGQNGYGFFRYATTPASKSWTQEGLGEEGYPQRRVIGVSCVSASFCAMADSEGGVSVATSESQVKSSKWTESRLGITGLSGIACVSTTTCVVSAVLGAAKLTIESSGKVSKDSQVVLNGGTMRAMTCTGSSTCVIGDSLGNVFVSTNSGEAWTKQYKFPEEIRSISCASSTLCVAADKTGKVTAFNPAGETPSEGEARAPQPGSTIEYNVPVSGVGAPHNMSSEELEKWGQKDDPVEAAAIFPPDEPQGWPASDYKRATVHYWDVRGRMVNTANPMGGIATSEYNESNEVIRALGADNRVAAMSEGCESKEKCKSAEAARKLDTESKYNGETQSEREHEEKEGFADAGGRLVETLGPEHKVKLAAGGEVLARDRVRYHYDEGAQEGQHYNLVTKTTDGAWYEGKEGDVRTTITSYGGQKGLGWTLRKPTSVTTDPTGLDLTTTTEYNETTGDAVERKSPAGSAEAVYPPAYSTAFGSEGSGNGQFKHASAVAVDTAGNVWVADKENGRIEKFSASGTYLAAYGSKGSGNDQFLRPAGIAINQSTGDVYVADTGNSRVEELSPAGEYVAQWGAWGTGEGQFEEPTGVMVDTAGNVWVADTGNNRVQEFSATGTFQRKFGSAGSAEGQLKEPRSLTMSGGELFVADMGNKRVDEFSPTGQFVSQFGTGGTGQGQFDGITGIAAAPVTGDLFIVDQWESRVEQFTPAGKFLTEFGVYGSGRDTFHDPAGIAFAATGEIYIADEENNRVAVWQQPGTGGEQVLYNKKFGSEGYENGQFYWPVGTSIDGHGNVWVADHGNNRIEEFSPTGTFTAAYGAKGSGEDQFSGPTGVAVNQSTGNVYVADRENNRIEELSSTGGYVRSIASAGSEPGKLSHPNGLAIDTEGNVWVADEGNNRIQEFSATGTFIAAYGSKGSGEGQFNEPVALTIADGAVYVSDAGNDRIQKLSTKGAYQSQFGHEGSGSGEFYTPEGIAADPAGNIYVLDAGNARIEEFSSAGRYLASFASKGSGEGQLDWPEGIAINAAGDLYIADSGHSRIQEWTPARQAVHDTKTVYYTAAEEAEASVCRKHPEWAGLVCQTTPAAQPQTSELPELPVDTYTYNIWDGIETTSEEFVSATHSKVVRTKTQTYDPAGRAVTSETASTIDAPLPKVTNEYNPETGALVKQSATIKNETKTISSSYNALGQLVEYTDAEGATTKYTYDADGRTTEAGYELPGKAAVSQAYSYDPTSGLLTKLEDKAPGASMTFTASDDVEGRMTSQVYPNGMCANTAYNQAGQATSLEYIKTRNCQESKPAVWLSDAITPGIHGETLAQTSTLASEAYAYDNAGRLTQVQETPAGKGCTTRLYSYDEEGNRTSLTTREPGTEGKCATEGGTTERHVYDPANRLTDEGVTYETFGNTTKLPASDAGEHQLTSEFYVDSQIASQTQNEETNKYLYDPAGRIMETTSEGKTAGKTISHYAGPGEALTWTTEASEKWARNIPGIGGTLVATQKNGQQPVLQLRDLQGNIVATAELSETATKLLSTYNSTEFGVPQPGTSAPPYSWHGASDITSELPSSGTVTDGASSYVPEIGRPLQTVPTPSPGAFPDGTGGYGLVEAPYLGAAMALSKTTADQIGANYEESKRVAAEEHAAESTCPASECHINGPGEGNCEANCVVEEEGEGSFGELSAESTAPVAQTAIVHHVGKIWFTFDKKHRLASGEWELTLTISIEFYPTIIPAAWKERVMVDGKPYEFSGGGGSINPETFQITISRTLTQTVSPVFIIGVIFNATLVDGSVAYGGGSRNFTL